MFTGIVEAIGIVDTIERRDVDSRIHIDAPSLDLDGVREGDSICVSGTCLTAVALAGSRFCADVSAETLARTRLGELVPGSRVNLEKSLTPATPLSGHLVTGHVDGVATLTSSNQDGRSVRFRFDAPAALSRYVVTKGSVCVDGVSLTVNDTRGGGFEVNIIPHTWDRTTLCELAPGDRVNLEVDMIARYLEGLLAARENRETGQ